MAGRFRVSLAPPIALAVAAIAAFSVPLPAQLIVDCNANGIPDSTELTDGLAFDCNDNGVLDECETDCNGNLLHDDCDLTTGTSSDCDGNGVPDECDSSPAYAEIEIGNDLEPDYAIFVDAGDITGDGDLDLVYTDGGTITWFENLDGVGGYGPERALSPGLTGRTITLADIDGDGDDDLVTVYIPFLEWHEYDEILGEFLDPVLLSSLGGCVETCCSLWAQLPTAADLDGDGDLDLIYRGIDISQCADGLVWYENLGGGGNFGEQQVIETTPVSTNDQPRAADIDGDGDVDLVSGGGGALRWYENDGSGGFTAHLIHAEPARRVEVADFDRDGDPDVVMETMAGTLEFLRNADGNGSFAGTPAPLPAVQGVLSGAADIDGDGDPDLVSVNDGDGSSGDGEDEFAYWHENTGSGFAEARLLTELGAPRTFLEHSTLFADLDLDGRLDLLFGFARGPGWSRSLSEDCNGNDLPDRCETDCNGNGEGDACDLRAGTSMDCDADAVPDECQTTCTEDCDADGDRCADELDCAPEAPGVWAESTPARGLSLGGGAATWMTWNPPEAHGSSEVRYDVLRFEAAGGFPSGVCLLADTTQTASEDAGSPGSGELFLYLIRARSGCPGSNGTLAPASDGSPRIAPPC